jgi:hypothetical protein
MGVACQAPAPSTGGLVRQLEAKGQTAGEDAREHRLASAQALKVRCVVSTIDGQGPVVTGLAGDVAHGHPHVPGSMSWVTTDEDKPSHFHEDRGGGRTLPLKSVECEYTWITGVDILCGKRGRFPNLLDGRQ